jgi:hypothetical protein
MAHRSIGTSSTKRRSTKKCYKSVTTTGDIPVRIVVGMVHRPTMKIAFLTVIVAASFCAAIADRRAIAGPSCGDGNAAVRQSASGATVSRNAAGKFERLYRTWHRQSEAIRYSSNTGDYVALPAYRGIVDLGPAALPFLEKKLAHDHDSDFMLAHAVVEICGWDRQAFASDSEQAFRDKILRKLKENE